MSITNQAEINRNRPADLYQFLLQQVVAESYIETASQWSNNLSVVELLINGANRDISAASGFQPGHTRLTPQQAQEFVDRYEILHQWSDNPTSFAGGPTPRPLDIGNGQQAPSNTGFSATLIRERGTNRLTLAMRSTEFKDWAHFGDNERDAGQADKEVALIGFAYAQLDAMRRHYDYLKTQGFIKPTDQLNVTGYSLGGHLATVFGEMYREDIVRNGGQIVTFNGAGRGSFASGTLSASLDFFRAQLNAPTAVGISIFGMTINPNLAALFQSFSSGRNLLERAQTAAASNQPFDPRSVYADPRYQWAALATAARFGHAGGGMANEYRTGTAVDDILSNVFGYELENNKDFTANSGIHGPSLRVGIESQPLVEGFGTSWNPLNLFGQDFGNAHSITLLGDSLALQQVLQKLDTTLTTAAFQSVMSAGSNVKTSNLFSSYRYEHDLLENILDGARAQLLGPAISRTESIPGVSPTYNERSGFGDIAMRTQYFSNLEQLEAAGTFDALVGKMTLRVGGMRLAYSARDDFADFTALFSLSPVYLGFRNPLDASALNGEFATTWGSIYSGWRSDRSTHGSDLSINRTFTDTWIQRRSDFLTVLVARNENNSNSNKVSAHNIRPGFVYSDVASNLELKTGDLLDSVLLSRQYVRFGGDEADELQGGGAHDFLFGGNGADALKGEEGHDWLEGNAGNDVLQGSTGNDSLLGGEGTDTYLFAGKFGTDTLIDDGGVLQIAGLGNLDVRKLGPGSWVQPDANGKPKLVISREGQDLVLSVNSGAAEGVIRIRAPGSAMPQAQAQSIASQDGPQLALAAAVAPLSSPDLNPAAFGLDLGDTPLDKTDSGVVISGDFEKQLTVNSEGHVVLDPTGNFISLGPSPNARDFLVGGTGNDQLSGLGGSDILYGYEGNDFLDGGEGANHIEGGEGSDTILGGAAADHIWTGGQSFYVDIGSQAVRRGTREGGTVLQTLDSVYVGLNAPENSGPPGTTETEWYASHYRWWVPTEPDPASSSMGAWMVLQSGTGKPASNGVLSDSAGDLVWSGAGNDQVTGAHGPDLLDVGDGSDFAWGSGGADTLLGGEGDDQLLGDGYEGFYTKDGNTWHDDLVPLDGQGADLLDGGEGNDSLRGQGGDDTLLGGAGNDTLAGDWRETYAEAQPYNGNDYLDGEEGDDSLEGGVGADMLLGGDGQDTLIGDDAWVGRDRPDLEGVDTLDGGAGNDSLVGGGAGDVLFGGDGDDALMGDAGTALALQYHGDDLLDGGAGNDTLNGQDGADTLSGGTGEDNLVAGEGADVLLGGDQDDQLYGEAGADQLLGEAGQDLLEGGAGDDTLDGGAGMDHLAGGAGNDVYVFKHAEAEGTEGGLGETVHDTEGSNRFVFEGVPAPDAAYLTGDTLTIYFGNGSTQLTPGQLVNAVAMNMATAAKVTSFEFEGLSLSLDALLAKFGVGPYSYKDAAGKTVLTGGVGAALLTPQQSGSLVLPGPGNDVLQLGPAALLRVFFEAGDGQDVWIESPSGPGSYSYAPPTLVLGSDFKLEDLRLVKTAAGQLELRFGSPDSMAGILGDGLSFQGFTVGTGWIPSVMSAVELKSGQKLNFSDLKLRGLLHEGSAAAELQTGTAERDVFEPSLGEDTLRGGYDSDVYRWGAGAGNDWVEEVADSVNESDRLELLGEGTTPADWKFMRVGNDLLVDSLLSGERLRVSGQFGGSSLESIVFANGVVWGATDLLANLSSPPPSNGNDSLSGGTGADLIDGLDGNDQIYGLDGDDTLIGGAGSDSVYGGPGADVLVAEWMQGGDGNDIYDLRDWLGYERKISESGADGQEIDRVLLPSGLKPEDLYISTVPGSEASTDHLDLSQRNLANGTTYNTVRVSDAVVNGQARGIERWEFSDGTVLTTADLLARRGGGRVSEAADWWVGFSGADAVALGAGNDKAYGGRGNDSLDGGTGNDGLEGQEGDDLYLFSEGSGVDVLRDTSGTDTLRFADLLPQQIRLTRDAGFDLLISRSDDGAQVRIKDQFRPISYGPMGGIEHSGEVRIERIEFANGVVWTLQDILANVPAQTADTLVGTLGDDIHLADSVDDVVQEQANGGYDILRSSVTQSLDANVEELQLTGDLAVDAWDNDGDNKLVGNPSNNTLWSSSGRDTLVGGAGDDTYFIDTAAIASPYQTDDQLVELAGGGYDVLYGQAQVLTLPEHFEELWLRRSNGLSGGYQLVGNALDNRIGRDTSSYYTPASLYINGGAGADTMVGDSLADTFVVDDVGDQAVDQKVGDGDTVRSSISFALGDFLENLILTGPGAKTGTGNAGANRMEGSLSAEADTLRGGSGNDFYVVDSGDVVEEAAGEGDDTVSADGGVLELARYPNVETGVIRAGRLIGTIAADRLQGADGGEELFGGDGNDTLLGGYGYRLDFLDGGAGDDELVASNNGDTLVGGAGNDRLRTADGALVRWGLGSGADTWSLGYGTGELRLELSAGTSIHQLTVARQGRDVRISTSESEHITLVGYFADVLGPARSSGGLTLSSNDGDGDGAYIRNALVEALLARTSSSLSDASELWIGTANDDIVEAMAGDDSLFGGGGSDVLDGGLGSDGLYGGEGNDVLRSESGVDVLHGEAGNDRYEIGGNVEFVLVAEQSGDSDQLRFTGALLPAQVQVRRLGSDLQLSWGTGASRVRVQNYFEANANSIELISFSDGTQWSATEISQMVTVVQGTEAGDFLEGTTAADVLRGLGGDDDLDGREGADTLDGGTGNDSLYGGPGDDTYIVDAAADLVYESADSGTDLVSASTNWTLGSHVENLNLTGSGDLNGTGNSVGNVLIGNSGKNRLDGKAGNDTLRGGAGDDTYVVDNAGDVIEEGSGEGSDAVESSISFTIPHHVERLILTGSASLNGTGNSLDNTLTGNGGANRLDGGEGKDTMAGGAGNDVYVVDNSDDVVNESSSAGTDKIESLVSWTLAANVEQLQLLGTNAVDGAGNSAANSLTGNAANNRLDGMGGSDTMAGGAGDDTYVVDASGDVISETANEGKDTVETALAYTLPAEVENLKLTGSGAVNGTGNALANSLAGNDANNRLDGKAGADTMAGGAGNDTYVVDSSGEVITEAANGGLDSVEAAVSFTLPAEVEKLTLTGTGSTNATGNTSANTLTGNSGANRLDGGAGADTMVGGAGNDTYVVDAAGDVVTEAASGGTDTIEAAISYTLPTEVEKLTLTGTEALNATGNATANTLTGNSGNNRLDGKAGADTMVGGMGDDTYLVDNASDVITEASGAGNDAIEASLNFTLPANVEELRFTGSTGRTGVGNTLANRLTGTSGTDSLSGLDGNDTLDGGAGKDTLVGGKGDDTYLVSQADDVITELTGEGTDTVQSAVTLTLATNLENLTLLGSSAINGTGNAANNVLVGNGAANTLTGGDGNDTLDGGAGNDSLVGGKGADRYRFGRGYGSDTITENDTTANIKDVVEFAAGIALADVSFKRNGNALEVRVAGSPSELLTIKDWYLGSQYKVEEFRFVDSPGTVITDAQAAGLVQAMAAFGGQALEVGDGDPVRRRHQGMSGFGIAVGLEAMV